MPDEVTGCAHGLFLTKGNKVFFDKEEQTALFVFGVFVYVCSNKEEKRLCFFLRAKAWCLLSNRKPERAICFQNERASEGSKKDRGLLAERPRSFAEETAVSRRKECGLF